MISSRPAYAGDYEISEAPLLALPTEVRAVLIKAYDNLFPDKQLEVLGVTIPSTVAEPSRSRITFDANAVKRHLRNKTAMPDVFEKSLNLVTWRQVKSAWFKSECSLDM